MILQHLCIKLITHRPIVFVIRIVRLDDVATDKELHLEIVLCSPCAATDTTAAASNVPKGKSAKSYKDFHNLPKTDAHCGPKNGLWYYCDTCSKTVAARTGRPFTLGRWHDHTTESAEHLAKVKLQEEMKRVELKKKSEGKSLTSMEQRTVDQLGKRQAPLNQFFVAKKKKASSASLPSSSASSLSASISSAPTAKPSATTPVTCEGMFPDYKKKGIKESFQAYALFASIDSSSEYKIRYVGQEKSVNFCSKACAGTKGTYCKTKNGTIFSCNGCTELR